VSVFPLVIASPAPMLDVHGFGGGSAAKIVAANDVRRIAKAVRFMERREKQRSSLSPY
jgi:hypothetical protein